MSFLKKFQKNEIAICIYLSLGIIFFLFFDYSISKIFYNLNSQTKSLFENLTHFGDSLYFFVPTIIIWTAVKILQNKNKIILTIGDISIFIFLNILLSGIVVQIFKHILGRPRPPMFHSNDLSSLDFSILTHVGILSLWAYCNYFCFYFFVFYFFFQK